MVLCSADAGLNSPGIELLRRDIERCHDIFYQSEAVVAIVDGKISLKSYRFALMPKDPRGRAKME